MWILLRNCSNLQNVDGFSKLINCSTLKLQFCHLLIDFNVLSKLTNLTKLHLTGNSRLRDMGLRELTNLTELYLNDLPVLQHLYDIEKLTNLTKLSLFYC